MDTKTLSVEASSRAETMANVSSYLRPKQACELLGIKKSTFYGLQSEKSEQFDPTFPSAFRVSKRTRVWDKAELREWLRSRAENIPEQSEDVDGGDE